MPALLLTETTCVSQAAGQRRRQAWGWGLGVGGGGAGGQEERGRLAPLCAQGGRWGRKGWGHLHLYK